MSPQQKASQDFKDGKNNNPYPRTGDIWKGINPDWLIYQRQMHVCKNQEMKK